MFHKAQKVAVVNTTIDEVHDLKTVQRITMPGGVNFGFENGVLDTGEETANSGEQIRAAGRVDQHLDAFAGRRKARPDHGIGVVSASPQHAGLPGHVAGFEAGEIAFIHVLPQVIGCCFRQAIQRKIDPCFLLLVGHVGHGLFTVRELSACRVIQIFQQLAFPGIPDMRTGAANIGHGQQIERREATQRADFGCEGGNNVGIAGVFFLRGARHDQMRANQPGHQFTVCFVEPVLGAKPHGIDCAQFRMVAAAAFGNVMKQRCQIQYFGLFKRGDQLAGER